MAKMTKVSNNGIRLSNRGFYRCGGKNSGRAKWWLKGNGGFIALPERIRGDYDIELDLALEPGAYVLGTGAGRDAIRIHIQAE